MANSIIMPKTGMAMEEGIIIEWRVKKGDKVAKGDVVALIETDKSTMELESDYDGVILAILGAAGETVPVTKVIAWVGQSGETIPVDSGPKAASPAVASVTVASATAASASPAGTGTNTGIAPQLNGGKIRATPAARALAQEKGIDLASLAPGGKSGEIRRADVEGASGSNATPLARRMAAGEGISLAGIRGSGQGGKIFSADLGATVSRRGYSAGLPISEDTRVALTNIQRITGKRMSESRRTIPEVTAHIRADVSRMLEIRSEVNAVVGNSGAKTKITINDFVLSAVVKVLLDHPRVNSVLEGDELIYKGSINLGMATATERGLVVPVIHNAQNYSLTGLSQRAAELAGKAREGKLGPDEMSGGTFTVSNIGMYGISSFTPIINPPEAAILGVCAIEDELTLDGEKVVNRKKMGLSLAFDHRIVDGAESSLFLKEIKDILEAPLLILV
jgi:pyruvate dehydrogenase E2 component (dihydrolipoamide acetyltransferase)